MTFSFENSTIEAQNPVQAVSWKRCTTILLAFVCLPYFLSSLLARGTKRLISFLFGRNLNTHHPIVASCLPAEQFRVPYRWVGGRYESLAYVGGAIDVKVNGFREFISYIPLGSLGYSLMFWACEHDWCTSYITLDVRYLKATVTRGLCTKRWRWRNAHFAPDCTRTTAHLPAGKCGTVCKCDKENMSVRTAMSCSVHVSMIDARATLEVRNGFLCMLRTLKRVLYYVVEEFVSRCFCLCEGFLGLRWMETFGSYDTGCSSRQTLLSHVEKCTVSCLVHWNTYGFLNVNDVSKIVENEEKSEETIIFH